jgi:hypothetical protein
MSPRFPSTGPHPTTVLLRLSIVLSALAGFGVGLTLLVALALGRAGDLPFAALAQAHGQVQALGFVGLFILGAGAQLLPGFLATPLARRDRIVLGGYLVAAGLVARVVGQPSPPGLARDVLLWLSALGELGGVLLCLSSYAQLLRRTIQPPELWRRLALVGFALLALSLLLNLVAVDQLAAGLAVVPAPLDLALIELELWGFATLVIFAVARKVFPRFLLLPPPDDRRLALGVSAYVLGVALLVVALVIAGPGQGAEIAVLGGELVKLVGIVVFLDGLRLYRRPVRASGAPGVTEPARRWLRLSFGWLVAAAALATIASLRGLLTGSLDPYFEMSAARHALGQGFLLTLIVGLGSRILPGFSAWAIARPRLLEGLVGAITSGAFLRVLGELGIAFGAPAGAPLAALGGTVAVIAFLVFGATLVVAVGQLPAARAPVRRRGTDGKASGE